MGGWVERKIEGWHAGRDPVYCSQSKSLQYVCYNRLPVNSVSFALLHDKRAY